MESTKADEKVLPIKIFGALLILNLFLALIILAFPAGKIPIGPGFSLDFVPLKKLFEKDTVRTVDALKVIAHVNTVDTNLVVLDKKTLEKLRKEKIDVPVDKRIQYPESGRNTLSSFFLSLVDAEAQQALVRILHYGDSQLEGDRISDYLRNRLQLRFGGWGPGIILPYDISNSRISVRQSESKNWVKYAIYGKMPKAHKGLFGIGASSYRYSSGGGTSMEITKSYGKRKITDEDGSVIFETDSSLVFYDTVITQKVNTGPAGAWFRIQNAVASYPRVRQYNRMTLIYSADEPFTLKVNVLGGKEINDIVPPVFAGTKTYDLGEVKTGVSLDFSGRSPYLYGVALDGNTGIAVDNFPMRGSSALGFDGINVAMLTELYRAMNVKLIIMQYGINLVPEPKTNYDWYERAFSKQLKAVRNAAPNASILVIGPSDMSRKTADGYETYPNVPLIRDAMKKAAFANGCAFWDLYTAMGGENSMVSWEKNKLAAKDFTHFSSEGARYVSEMLYNALMDEYMEYLKEQGVM